MFTIKNLSFVFLSSFFEDFNKAHVGQTRLDCSYTLLTFHVIISQVTYQLIKAILDICFIITPLYNFFHKKISYRAFWCIMSLTKTLQRKVTLYDKNIIQRKNSDW